MIDRTTKILLGIIAIGLWANLFGPISTVTAQDYEKQLDDIADSVARISMGTCINRKICGY